MNKTLSYQNRSLKSFLKIKNIHIAANILYTYWFFLTYVHFTPRNFCKKYFTFIYIVLKFPNKKILMYKDTCFKSYRKIKFFEFINSSILNYMNKAFVYIYFNLQNKRLDLFILKIFLYFKIKSLFYFIFFRN